MCKYACLYTYIVRSMFFFLNCALFGCREFGEESCMTMKFEAFMLFFALSSASFLGLNPTSKLERTESCAAGFV